MADADQATLGVADADSPSSHDYNPRGRSGCGMVRLWDRAGEREDGKVIGSRSVQGKAAHKAGGRTDRGVTVQKERASSRGRRSDDAAAG